MTNWSILVSQLEKWKKVWQVVFLFLIKWGVFSTQLAFEIKIIFIKWINIIYQTYGRLNFIFFRFSIWLKDWLIWGMPILPSTSIRSMEWPNRRRGTGMICTKTLRGLYFKNSNFHRKANPRVSSIEHTMEYVRGNMLIKIPYVRPYEHWSWNKPRFPADALF
jgi:hypothetical protein